MRRIALTVSIILTGLLVVGSAEAVDRLDEIFERGNEAFLEGDYEVAIEEYERLIELGIADPDVYYNLGLSQVRSDRLGYAIHAFEQALRLAPTNDEARNALDSARTLLARRQADREGEATMRSDTSILDAAFRSASSSGLSWGALFTWNLTFLCLIAWRLGRRERLRLSAATLATLAALVASVCITGTAVKSRVFSDGEDAIFVAAGGMLREGPDHRTSAQGSVQEGTRCVILRTEGQYHEVRCATGDEGWCPTDAVLPIHR